MGVAIWTLTEKHDSDEIGFYSSTTGERINCASCEIGSVENKISTRANGRLGRFEWGPSDNSAVALSYNGVKVEFVYLEFVGNNYFATQIGLFAPESFKQSSVGFSPDGKAVAWYFCEESCELRWFDVGEKNPQSCYSLHI